MSITLAWQTTEEDVSAVLANTNLDEISNSEFYMRKLDYDKIAEAALIGDDLESQTAFAHQEIENQIRAIVETFDKE